MIDELLKKYPIISDQIEIDELKIILSNLSVTIDNNVVGDVVEMGCFVGTTSLFISRLLKQKSSDKKFHVYDSFEGLPEKSQKDSSPAGEQFKAGELRASKKTFIDNYKKAGLSLPHIHKCWFNELGASDVPEKISYAFLDGDYYDSIKSCLMLIEGKLQPGSFVVVDDYQNEALPGVKKAVDEWLAHNHFPIKTERSLAIIKVTKQ